MVGFAFPTFFLWALSSTPDASEDTDQNDDAYRTVVRDRDAPDGLGNQRRLDARTPGFGTVVIENSRVDGNPSYGSGGGIELGTDLSMYRSRVLGNSAALDGGGIHAFRNAVTLAESTVIDNEASENGGGLYLAGNQTTELSHLVNSTVTGNTAGRSGGGLYLDTSDLTYYGLTLDNVTITENVADADDDNDGNAGGLYRDGTSSSLEMQNSILAGNVDASTGDFALVQRDCRATIDSLGYNVIGTVQAGCTIDGSTRGNVIGSLSSPVNPQLGAASPSLLLPVHVPESGSPAVDGGNPLGCTAWNGRLLTNDEPGDPRPAGSACDVGAVESPHAEPPTLTVEVTGTADGIVTSSPAGISCPGDCTQEYGSVTNVTLTAAPVDSQDSFAGWSGDPECLDGKVTMDRHMLCIATFEAAPTYSFQLTILGTGSGSVHVMPFNFTVTTTFGATVDEGETVTMSPSTELGSQFMGFGGDADCSDGSVTISGDVECTATFDAMPDRSFTLNVIGSGSGSVNVAPPDVDVTTSYTTTYSHGQTVTMTPTADPGSFFTVFSGDVDCADGEVTMTEDLVCTATFDPTGALIFTDGFEEGLPGGWSNVVP